MVTIDQRLARQAERQHGLITLRQREALGLSEDQWRHRLRRRDWVPVTDRVARRAGAPETDAQRAMAAVLDVAPSSYLSHASGAATWGVPGWRVHPAEVIVLRERRTPSPLATVHHPRHLPDPFAAVVDGMPVVRPALVLLQLAPRVGLERLGRMLDDMWSRRLLSGPSVRAELAPLLHRGRPGVRALRAVLDERGPAYVPPASNLEARLNRIVREAGMPEMRRQVDLGGTERWSGRVDFLAPDLPLVIEVDSERYHSALSDQVADAARQRSLEAAGFRVVRVAEHDIWHDRARAVDIVRASRRAARAGCAA